MRFLQFVQALNAMNFPIGTTSTVSPKSGYAGHSFSLKSRKTLISLLIPALTQQSFSRELFRFHELVSSVISVIAKMQF